MKTLLKISIILISFSGIAFAQTVNPAVGSNSTLTTPCNYTLCSPFQNSDMQKIYQAIMVTSSGGAITSASIVSGNMGGFTSKASSSLTVDGVYTASLNMGGIKSFTAMRSGQTTCVLEDVSIFDTGSQSPSIVIDFYEASPSGTFNDRTTSVTNDYNSYLGSISVSTSDYVTVGGISRATLRGCGLVLKNIPSSGITVYYTITVTGGSYTYSSKVINLKFGLLQD